MTPENNSLREKIAAFDDFLNEPQRSGETESLDIREYRHAAYKHWRPALDAILAAISEAGGEPVHWRAVLAADQVAQQLNPDLHVVGFRNLASASSWVASKLDFDGWRYTIEPLYTAPPTDAAKDERIEELHEITKLMREAELQFNSATWSTFGAVNALLDERDAARAELATANKQIADMGAKLADAEKRALQCNADADMYAKAWERELRAGGFLRNKRHHIDMLVVSTRDVFEALAETRKKLAAIAQKGHSHE